MSFSVETFKPDAFHLPPGVITVCKPQSLGELAETDVVQGSLVDVETAHLNARVTVRNLEVVQVDADDSLLVVRGAVPGPNGGYVLIRRVGKSSTG